MPIVVHKLQKIMEVFLKRLGVVLKNFGFKGDF
jgi:hypothetical protein